MPFTTSGQETEWALFLQPRIPYGVHSSRIEFEYRSYKRTTSLLGVICTSYT